MSDLPTVIVAVASGGVGVAVVGLIGARIGAWIERRDEHDKWLREKRMAANLAYMHAVNQIQLTFSSGGSVGTIGTVAESISEATVLQVVGPLEVWDLGALWAQSVYTWSKDQSASNEKARNKAMFIYTTAARKSITRGR